jgi:hypothetical protein
VSLTPNIKEEGISHHRCFFFSNTERIYYQNDFTLEDEKKERKENMFAAKTSIRNYVCRRTIHPRDVMSSSSSSVAAAASAGQYNCRYLSKNMSSSPMMMEASAEEESHFALILGKPGGGKGTISGKILKVRFTRVHNKRRGRK